MHKRDSGVQITQDELRANADDAEACALLLAIAAGVRARLACVNGVIGFNDALEAWRQEVSDEEPSDGHLAAKRDAELTSLEADQRAASDSVSCERCWRAKCSSRAADFESMIDNTHLGLQRLCRQIPKQERRLNRSLGQVMLDASNYLGVP